MLYSLPIRLPARQCLPWVLVIRVVNLLPVWLTRSPEKVNRLLLSILSWTSFGVLWRTDNKLPTYRPLSTARCSSLVAGKVMLLFGNLSDGVNTTPRPSDTQVPNLWHAKMDPMSSTVTENSPPFGRRGSCRFGR